MSDIIYTQAWTCGDKDCAAQWHVRNFWAYGDGTYSVDEYSDEAADAAEDRWLAARAAPYER